MLKKVKARGKTRYRVLYREGAKQRSKTFDTEREAKAFEGDVAKAKSGVIDFPKAKISNQTLNEFGLDYWQNHVMVDLSPGTQQIYRAVWNNHIQPRLGSMPLSSITSETVQKFKADMMNDGVGDPTIHKSLSVLSAMLNKAVAWQRISYNPCSSVRKPSAKRKSKIQPMAPESIVALLQKLRTPQDKLLVSLIAYAGLRPGEALALTKADIGQNTITIDKAIALGSEKDTKTGKDRYVPIMNELRPFLTHLPDGLLFPKNGSYWKDHDYRNWRKRSFKPAVENGFRPYDLRHSFGSRLLMEGYSPLETADIMGNSVEVLLSTYAHVIAEMRFTNGSSA